MFRIVTEQVDQPAMFLMCDHDRCSVIATMCCGEMTPATNIASIQEKFIQGALAQGWMVTLGKQLCPYHLSELTKQQSGRIVVVPSLVLN